MKILIGTDGSEFSRQAIAKCCEIVVGPEDTEIRVLSVYENLPLTATEPFMVSVEYAEEMEKLAREQADRIVADAEKQIRECLPNVSVKLSEKVAGGAAERAIIEEAEKWRADLIVVGSHGRGFWKRVFLGSVSQSVVQHAPCSVLVVRGTAAAEKSGLKSGNEN